MALKNAKDDADTAFSREAKTGLSYENTFGGALSFLRRRYTKDIDGAELIVTGIPFDQAVTNRPGTRLGPRAIREASTLQPGDPPYGWGFDPLGEHVIIDHGDIAFDYGHVARFPAALTAHISKLMAQGAGTLAFGGDHYITYPILRAYAEKYGPMSLVQFDAHTDTWADDDMERICHGTMFYKAVKQGLVDPARSVQIGIRTVNSDRMGFNIIDARKAHEMGPAAVAARVKEIVGDHPVYLTFDIDGLDPAFAPGTGTPVWGGLHSWQASAMLRDLAGINMKGGDVVEVSPPFDSAGATAIAGAHVATDLMCLYLWNRRQGA